MNRITLKGKAADAFIRAAMRANDDSARSKYGAACKKCGEPKAYAKQYGCPQAKNDCPHKP